MECREIVRVASKANNWGTGWVYDGRKNIFATRQFLPRHAQTVTVRPLTVLWLHNADIGGNDSACQISISDSSACRVTSAKH